MRSRGITRPCERGQQLQQLELTPGEAERAAADEGLEHVRPDLELAGDDRLGGSAVTAACLPRAQRRLDPGQHLLGVARLGDPVVGAEPQAPHPLGDRGRAGADDHRLARRDARRAARGRPTPPSRASPTSITIACWRMAWTLLDRRRAGQHLRAPADGADALREHAHEAAVGVDDREPRRRRGGEGAACVWQTRCGRLRAIPLTASVGAAPTTAVHARFTGFSHRGHARFNQPCGPATRRWSANE